MIDEAMIVARIVELNRQRKLHEDALMALSGAMQVCEQWLAFVRLKQREAAEGQCSTPT